MRNSGVIIALGIGLGVLALATRKGVSVSVAVVDTSLHPVSLVVAGNTYQANITGRTDRDSLVAAIVGPDITWTGTEWSWTGWPYVMQNWALSGTSTVYLPFTIPIADRGRQLYVGAVIVDALELTRILARAEKQMVIG